MAAGIAGGRFALQRANRIQKQSAVDNIEQALWGYYTDKRQFPAAATPANLTTSVLSEYLDAGAFDGGADGTFWYYVHDQQQEFMVCTSFGGLNDANDLGVYCTGNGIETIAPFSENPVPTDNVYETNDDGYAEVLVGGNSSNWYGENRSWTQP